nr:2-amino-4-hydroxy-6-hydroxymethyldihydropteridine diphosphokinase [Bacteroides sp.]
MNKTALVVGIGSNTTDREFRMQSAIEALCGKFTDANVSAVYETQAVNGHDAPYFNAVFSGMTTMTMEDVIVWLKEQERLAGRNELENIEGQVHLDLDLVIWDGRIVRPADFDRTYFNIGYRQLLAEGAFQYNV